MSGIFSDSPNDASEKKRRKNVACALIMVRNFYIPSTPTSESWFELILVDGA